MSSFLLKSKVFIITGAASGMGLSTSVTLLSRGASVAFCDINQSAMEQAISSLNEDEQQRATANLLDVTDADNVASVFQAVKSRHGHVHGIANFAGTGGHKLGLENVWQTTTDEFNFIVNLNIRGLYNTLNIGLQPGYLEEGGSFVHIASMFSERGFKKGAVFSASKHAAIGMIKSAAMETGERVRVNVVLPGAVDTPMHRATLGSGAENPVPNSPISRAGKPQEVANVTAFLLSDESTFVTGASWTVDGGANA